MKYLIKARAPIFILLVILFTARSIRADGPSQQEWLGTSTGLALAAGLEVLGKDRLVPDLPRWSTPNGLDARLREALWWGSRQDQARRLSDVLIYGVSMSSLIWAPLLSQEQEKSLYINANVFLVNSLLSNLIKVTTARERPYRHFGSRASEGPRDYTSFISGHSSVAFSQAVANAMLLSKDHPDQEPLIFGSLLGLAGLTGYLRVAGDMHYASDVTAGAILGSAVGWAVTKYLTEKYEASESDAGDSILVRERSGIPKTLFSIRIPLG